MLRSSGGNMAVVEPWHISSAALVPVNVPPRPCRTGRDAAFAAMDGHLHNKWTEWARPAPLWKWFSGGVVGRCCSA
jgi:hypothetical protein